MRAFPYFLFAIMAVTSIASANEGTPGQLVGAWVPSKIGPISGAFIYAFDANAGPPPYRGGARRVANSVATTGDNGKFTMKLPEGSYYLSAWKKSGDNPGPPNEGELHGLSRNKKGEPIKYRIKGGETTDVGSLHFGSNFKPPAPQTAADLTGIDGTIKTPEGTPISDAVVMVYNDPNMQGKPSYVGRRTGKDGHYLVQVDQEGTYYVSVRNDYGIGRPESGDAVGLYGKGTAEPVTVKKQTLTKGIDICLGQFIDHRPQDASK